MYPEIFKHLDNRRFIVANNTHGLSSSETVFCYFVDGETITGTYQGGRIRVGNQVGRVTGTDTFELLYQCVTTEGELLAGWSRGRVSVDHLGRTTQSVVEGSSRPKAGAQT